MLERFALPRVPAAAHQFAFDAEAPAVLHVDPGETVLVETLDCFCGRLTDGSPPLGDDSDVLRHIGGRYNPVSGPIHVRGAEPGDTLAVDVVDIALGMRQGFAVTHVARDWAREFGGESFAAAVAPASIFAAVKDGRLAISIGERAITCEARPMIGTIGTAPADAARSSLLYAPSHGGNLDCPMIRPGATVLLPVNVAGALLSLGDVHALMGEGEVTGTALETSADITLRIRLEKATGTALRTPRVVDRDTVGSIGCASRLSPHENVRSAVLDLVRFLSDSHGMAPAEALQLVNLFGRIVVNQSVAVAENGWSSVLVSVRRTDLERFAGGGQRPRPGLDAPG
jgi:amidase